VDPPWQQPGQRYLATGPEKDFALLETAHRNSVEVVLQQKHLLINANLLETQQPLPGGGVNRRDPIARLARRIEIRAVGSNSGLSPDPLPLMQKAVIDGRWKKPGFTCPFRLDHNYKRQLEVQTQTEKARA
jgi:hypothetical protein